MIPVGDKIYDVTHVQIIPPSDCMKEYKLREKLRLEKYLNVKILI